MLCQHLSVCLYRRSLGITEIPILFEYDAEEINVRIMFFYNFAPYATKKSVDSKPCGVDTQPIPSIAASILIILTIVLLVIKALLHIFSQSCDFCEACN